METKSSKVSNHCLEGAGVDFIQSFIKLISMRLLGVEPSFNEQSLHIFSRCFFNQSWIEGVDILKSFARKTRRHPCHVYSNASVTWQPLYNLDLNNYAFVFLHCDSAQNLRKLISKIFFIDKVPMNSNVTIQMLNITYMIVCYVFSFRLNLTR